MAVTVSRSAKPENTVVLDGTGFPAKPFGPAAITTATVANAVTITIGGIPATVQFAGITAAGECQFNVQVPTGLGSGDQPVVATVQGISTQSGVSISVQP